VTTTINVRDLEGHGWEPGNPRGWGRGLYEKGARAVRGFFHRRFTYPVLRWVFPTEGLYLFHIGWLNGHPLMCAEKLPEGAKVVRP